MSKMLILGNEDKVYQYTLSTPEKIDTASYDTGADLDVSGKDSGMEGVRWTSDGTKLLLLGRGNDKVYQYSVN